MALTELGKSALGIDEPAADRLGGREHRYWCKVLAERLRSEGYEVAEEAPVGGGKTVDLLAVRGGKRIAFEVETGNSDAAANARKCLDAGVDQVVVVATSRHAADGFRKLPSLGPAVSLMSGSEAIRFFSAADETGRVAGKSRLNRLA
jgi:hypothetical protein